MTMFKSFAVLAAVVTLGACTEGVEGGGLGFTPIGPDKSVDRGVNAHHLSTLVAGIWVDTDGCDHWIIDDGVEGYLSARLTPDGLPVYSGVAPPNTAVGPFESGSPIPDHL